MGGTSQLDSLTGISENDITLIEQILKSKGDDVLNDFFKDSKIASKSFSLKDPRWKGTKKIVIMMLLAGSLILRVIRKEPNN